ncbi:MAG: sulfatase [Cyclobacteriaceae bacterium]
MRTIVYLTMLCWLLLSCKQEPVTPPNVLLIVADDLGWTDLENYGSTFYDTPNLNKLGDSGIKFTNGYATCPVCSPSRASIQTGKYPVKTGITDWIPGRKNYAAGDSLDRWIAADNKFELDLEEKTVAELLAERGYKTMFSGKWHLGGEGYLPQDQGYEVNAGGLNRGAPNRRGEECNGYFAPYCNPQLEDGPVGEYLPERLAQETRQFIEKNKEQPLFINLSFYLVHTPLQAKEELKARYQEKRQQTDTTNELLYAREWMKNATTSRSYKERVKQAHPTYAAMVKALDDNVGRVINELEAAGLLENTMIIFTSDNGGLSTSEGSPTSNLPLRAGKGWLYEGGIRVPFLVKMPGNRLSGLTSEVPVTGADILPMILHTVDEGYEITESIDGINILATLENTGERPLFWHYPHYSNQGGNPGSAIRLGNYKLIDDFETGQLELYDLSVDIGETNNLASAKPEIKDQLYQMLEDWRDRNNVQMMEKENEKWIGVVE